MREPATCSMSGQYVAIFLRLTRLRANQLQRPVLPGFAAGYLNAPEPLVSQIPKREDKRLPSYLNSPKHHLGVGGVVGDDISGFTPLSRSSRVSRTNRESRGVPGHDHRAGLRRPWSFSAFSQVMPRL